MVPSDSRVVLDALHDLYTSIPGMSGFVDVHLVLSPFPRQLNTWRNAARLFARTEFVMMLDVDFAICTDFRSHIRAGLDSEVGRALRDGHAALVVPAFEYVNQQDGINSDTFPSDKKVFFWTFPFVSMEINPFQVLLELVQTEKIDMFHKSWAPGHNSSDYPRFYTVPPGEVYRIKQYQSAYEPYVIFKKEGPPWYVIRTVVYPAHRHAVGAMSASLDMGEIRQLVCMKCICPECHFLCSRIISWFIKAICMKKPHADLRYVIYFGSVMLHLTCHLSLEAKKQSQDLPGIQGRNLPPVSTLSICNSFPVRMDSLNVPRRYLRQHRDTGTLNTTMGRNVIEECKKLKGVSSAAVYVRFISAHIQHPLNISLDRGWKGVGQYQL